MNKLAVALVGVGCAFGVWAAEPAAKAVVTIEPGKVVGKIKPMNATNGGPVVSPVNGDQKCGNFADFQALRVPYVRIHDVINGVAGGAHCGDTQIIFPDFDADENDPKNYDFVFTDHYLDSVQRSGSRMFFRLGPTIEHGPKKYGVLPPKDYAKWARICEHIVRHYTEGWGWGVDQEPTTRNMVYSNQFDFAYLEVWNEPDLDYFEDITKNLTPRCWGGTVTNYFEFYAVAAKHLKKCFPKMKIGGPSLAWYEDFAERFLDYVKLHDLPLDFFSWHLYARSSQQFVTKARTMRGFLDKRGFTKTESILNEWNYVKGWGDDFVYSKECMVGSQNQVSAAFAASVMSRLQDAPLDLLMFYNAFCGGGFGSLFDHATYAPRKAYYPFYAWSKLQYDYVTQVAASIEEGTIEDTKAVTGFVEKKDKALEGDFTAIAAKRPDGKLAVFVTRFTDDRNCTDTASVYIRIPGRRIERGFAHLTDRDRSYTEVPLIPQSDGSALLAMQPLSFALIEL